MSGDVFGCHGLEGRGATGISWLEPRDTAKCPTICIELLPTMMNYLVQSINVVPRLRNPELM